MKYFLSYILAIFMLTCCKENVDWVEKEIERCILEKSTNTYDRDEEVNQIMLSIDFEELLLGEKLLGGKSPDDYRRLFSLLLDKEIDTIKLAEILKKSSDQNLDLLGYPTFHSVPYACVNEIQQKYPQAFESSQSLDELFNSLDEFAKTMDLSTVVNLITSNIPNSEFEKKIIYRVPVITVMYSITEQTHEELINNSEK